MKDPIVAEVRRIRDQLAAKYDYDLKAIFKASRKREKKCGHSVVSFQKDKKTG
jgi:hypothetical protein